MKLYFGKGPYRLIVDSFGAFIESYVVYDKPLFYEKQVLENGKTRGGLHVCLPNFGIDLIEGLDPHGYGRKVEWEILAKDEFSVVLSTNGLGAYEKLRSYLVYELLEDGLECNLTMTNTGKDTLFVAPGFHPYFYVGGKDYTIDDEIPNIDRLEGTYFKKEKEIILKTEDYTAEITGENINQYAIWSDNPTEYVCVEPTYHGPAFRPGHKNCYDILPGKSFKITMRLRFS